MVNCMVRTILFSVLLILVSPLAAAQTAEVIASVDKNPVIQGEPFTLTVTINDDVSQAAWQPEEQLRDFRVLNVRSSRRTSVINGETSRTTSFIVNLQAPDMAGIVRIPPLQIGNASSNAIELTILDAATSTDELEQRPAFIRTSLESNQVYVQQQFKLVARLYLSANLHSGNLVAPELDDAEVSQFGQDEESYEIINGKRYQVFQRTYLVTPLRSGELTIRGPIFEGQISRESGRSVFSSIATTQPVSAAAAPKSINVLARPGDWTGHWLPSELVSLSVERANPEATVEVGQPITLTYRLTAIGVSPEQLPELNFDGLTDVSVYPEAAEFASTTRNGRVIAQRSQTVAIIPRSSGELTLPALDVAWFNTRLQQKQLASSQPIVVNVQPAPNAPSEAEQQTAEPDSAISADSKPSAEHDAPTALAPLQSHYFILAVVFAGLWLLTLIVWAWWWLRQQRSKSVSAHAEQVHKPNHAWQQLQQAALANDAVATEQALRDWAHQQLSLPMHDLREIAEHFKHQPLHSQIDHLQRCRYASADKSWLEGKALLRALKAAQKHLKQQPKAKPSLSPLYPN